MNEHLIDCRHFTSSFSQKYVNEDEDAYEEVRRGRAWAALVIQPNYTNALVERVEDGRYAEDGTVEASDLGVRMDWSSK